MMPEDVVFDPFVSRDRIPRTPPAALETSLLLRRACSSDAGLRDNPQTSMFQTDQNRPRYLIRLRDSPKPQNRSSLQCPSSLDVRSGASEKNVSSSTSPSLTHVEESAIPMISNAPEVVGTKTATRRGRTRGEEKYIRAIQLPDMSLCLSSGETGKVIGTPRSHVERKSHLEATSVTTAASGLLHTSDFERLGCVKRRQKSTRSSPPPSSRYDLRRINLCLNGSAPRHCRRRREDRENAVSPSFTSTAAINTAVRRGRRGKCHKSLNSPPQPIETSNAILGSLGSFSCRRSQRNVVRVNYAGL
ncbi:hypothetical protein TSMEX_006170 [Taenia solium]|eukprot:TsM_000145100 transcript=TsM_000145100 gene=TsM_000145100